MSTSYTENGGSVGKARVRSVNRNQVRMDIIDVEGLIEEDHPARAIWDLSFELDLTPLYERIGAIQGRAGRNAYDPRVLLCVWVYCYSRGWSSAREVSRLSRHEPALRWLTGLEAINYHTLADFRMQNESELDHWMTELLSLLSQAGLVSLERVAQDGTRIRAHASDNSWSGKESLEKHLELVREQIRELKSAEYEERTKRQQQAQKRAYAEKKQRLERARRELEKLEKSKSRSEKARVSRSDPEARIMKRADGGYGPSYNVQMMTDEKAKVVVAVDVCNSAADVHQLLPLLHQVEERLGEKPGQVLTDGGYTSAENVEKMSEQEVEYFSPLPKPKPCGQFQGRGVEPEFWPERFVYDAQDDSYQCPAGERLPLLDRRERPGKIQYRYRARHSVCQNCAFKAKCCPRTRSHGRSIVRSEATPAALDFQQRMTSETGRQTYRKRGEIAEFPFAWIKEKMGFRTFRLRGLLKVRTEILWAALVYDFQIWKRYCWTPKPS